MSKPPAKPPEHIPVFFHVTDGFFFSINGRLLNLKKSDLFMHLRSMGLSDSVYHKADVGSLRELDWVLWNAQRNRVIHYAGSLGGHKKGIYSDGGGRNFLVTEQAAGVYDDIPKKAPNPEFFIEFIQELLPDEQWLHFCHWLAIALRSLRKGDFRPGQVCVFAGPVQCGKSLLQDVVTQILGGRDANPMRYMMEETSFNKDLAESEHWKIEEPKTSTDIRTRIAFANAIKECFTNRDFSVHGKGKEAIIIRIFRRGTISVNDDPELLMVIPPLNGSIDDKLNLYHCARVTKAFDRFRGMDGTPALFKEETRHGELDQAALWTHVLSELPLIRSWLLRSFKSVPPELRAGDDRMGIAAFHHPQLKQTLASFAPENRLLELVDELLFSDQPSHSAWEGRAVELEKKLRDSQFAFEAEKALRHMGRLGAYLGKLERSSPKRVSKRILGGNSLWTIHPPSRPNGE